MSEEVIIARETENVSGTVQISGAKNSALKLIAATMLGQGKSTLHNIPHISDIEIMNDVIRSLGATVEWDGHSLIIDTEHAEGHDTPYELVSKMRASISVLGPLVGRFGCARVAMPGGCKIGARKIDMHLKVLEAMGVEFENSHRLPLRLHPQMGCIRPMYCLSSRALVLLKICLWLLWLLLVPQLSIMLRVNLKSSTLPIC